jgi:hypothetical protein
MADYSLLTVGHDAKTIKGEKKGYLTGILYLAPASLGGPNLCAYSTPGCRAGCLYTAGRGIMAPVQAARLRRTTLFHADRDAFMAMLVTDIQALIRAAKRRGMKPAVRLNGTSDLPWENIRLDHEGRRVPSLIEMFPRVQFYDYTKNPVRAAAGIGRAGRLPRNYSLTFSRSETEENERAVLALLHNGANVAVVFPTKEAFPATWHGYKVFDGDRSDLRFLDPPGSHVIGLRAKGKARQDTSGFVAK